MYQSFLLDGSVLCRARPVPVRSCRELALTDSEQSPTRLVLWDPVSRAEVPLPCLPAAAQVFLSGDPLASAGSGWTAFAGQKASPSRVAQRLFSWRPGDAAWSPLQEGGAVCRIDGAAFHHGRAYLIDASWRLRVYDLGAGAGAGASPPRLVRSTSLRASAVKVFNSNGRSWLQTLRTLHAVPCGGELLLVLTYGGHRPAPAEVYRADWEAEPLVEIGERVRDLGEHSLFVGRGDAFALSAREFPAVRRNRVYYVEQDNFWREHWWVTVLDLGTNPLPRGSKGGRQRVLAGLLVVLSQAAVVEGAVSLNSV